MEEVKVSLLDQFMQKCVILNKTTTLNDYGGFETAYTEGAEFDAAIVFDTSIQARIADKSGVTSLYTVTTGKNIFLMYHDVFKRLSDGKIFRVTSDGDDKYTPNSASLNMRQVTAEEFNIIGGGQNG